MIDEVDPNVGSRGAGAAVAVSQASHQGERANLAVAVTLDRCVRRCFRGENWDRESNPELWSLLDRLTEEMLQVLVTVVSRDEMFRLHSVVNVAESPRIADAHRVHPGVTRVLSTYE